MSTLLSRLTLGPFTIELQQVASGNLLTIVRLLAADPLGSSRERTANDEDLQPYHRTYEAIDANPTQLLVVTIDGDEIVGTMQLPLIPGLARRSALGAEIEAVRVYESYRSMGLGAGMIEWAILEARCCS